METEIFYIGRENEIARQLVRITPPNTTAKALSPEEMESITKVEIFAFGKNISSADHPGAFDWYTLKTEGILIIKLNGIITEPGEDREVELSIYDLDHPDGLLWDVFSITAKVIE